MDDDSSDWKASHRLSIRVACPSCGSSGEMQVREDGGPPFTDTPRRTYVVDLTKFSFLVGGQPPAMACVACGAQFPRAA